MPVWKSERSPYYWYDFYLGRKRYRGSTKQKNEDDAEVYLLKLQALMKAQDSSDLARGRMHLSALLDGFLRFNQANARLAPRTRDYYQLGARLLMETDLARRPIETITSSMISMTSFDCSPSNANMALRTLRRALWLATDWGAIPKVPRVHLYREKMRTRIFTAEEEQRLIDAADQPLRDVFLLLINTGARPNEIMALKWDDIDWTRNVMYLSRGKTAASVRFLGLTTEVVEVLQRRRIENKSVFVFPSNRSSSGRVTSLAHAFARARKAAGLPRDLVLYSTRHTFATNLIAESKDRHLVAAQLGHSNVVSTERYIHPDISRVAEHLENIARKRRMEGLNRVP